MTLTRLSCFNKNKILHDNQTIKIYSKPKFTHINFRDVYFDSFVFCLFKKQHYFLLLIVTILLNNI